LFPGQEIFRKKSILSNSGKNVFNGLLPVIQEVPRSGTLRLFDLSPIKISSEVFFSGQFQYHKYVGLPLPGRTPGSGIFRVKEFLLFFKK
jgi:hypothetical protein